MHSLMSVEFLMYLFMNDDELMLNVLRCQLAY